MKTTYSLTQASLLAAILALCAGGISAQDSAEKMSRPSIRVTGVATMSAKPDQAQIEIGVVAQAQTAQAAATRNAQQLEAVIAELRKALGPDAGIKTISYALNPLYRYPKEGGQPAITGYTATNIVQVKINNLDDVGKAIDLATQSGANTIQSLQFKLKDEQAAQAQALREAAMKARAKAEALASALGLKLGRVLLVEEGTATIVRPMRGEVADQKGFRSGYVAPTPVESGTIDIHATVTLTVEVAP